MAKTGYETEDFLKEHNIMNCLKTTWEGTVDDFYDLLLTFAKFMLNPQARLESAVLSIDLCGYRISRLADIHELLNDEHYDT